MYMLFSPAAHYILAYIVPCCTFVLHCLYIIKEDILVLV